MKRRRTTATNGFTLIEMLVAMAVIAVIIFPLIITYRSARANHALRTSSEGLADVIRVAHIYAREARDKQSWGVTSNGDKQYQLVYGSEEGGGEVEQVYNLEPGITFDSEFSIWFLIGTGETASETEIVSNNEGGQQMKVKVYKTGIVEVLKGE